MSLGELQQLTMLAVIRLGDEAYGSAIQEELERVADRRVSVSTIHVTLVRLEQQGIVESEKQEPDPRKGGRGKRIFRLTPSGRRSLEESRAAMSRMWRGVAGA